MSPEKREKRFLELVRASKLVPEPELDRALAFQAFARNRGKELPLDRILLKFELLTEIQIKSLYVALRYFTWRKEDKFYAKLAVQSSVLSPEDAARCLKEQKRYYKEKRLLKRVNEIAHEKGILAEKEDQAIVDKIHALKPKATIRPLTAEPIRLDPLPAPPPPLDALASDDGSREGLARGPRGPARAGEEEQWRRDMRARELAELSNAARHEPGLSSSQPLSDDGPLELDLDLAGNPQARLSASTNGRITDDDLDPLWDEADLDDIDLDSGQKSARGSAGSSSGGSRSSIEDEEDLFS